MNIEDTMLKTNSVITLLIGQFDKDHEERVDNETIFHAITVVKGLVDEINNHVLTVAETSSIEEPSAATVLTETITKMTEKVSDVLEILYDQFSSDKECCLSNETIHTMLVSVRKKVTKIAGVADDFIKMTKSQA